MSEVSIQIDSNLASVLARFEALPSILQRAIRLGLYNGLSAVRGQMQRNMTTLFQSHGAGGMRQSVMIEVQNDAQQLSGRIWVASDYAHVHEFGTVGKGGRLPDIVPVRAKALHFTMKVGHIFMSGTGVRLKKPQAILREVFCKRVSIPPRPFFYPALESHLDRVPRFIRQQVNAALESMSGDKPEVAV